MRADISVTVLRSDGYDNPSAFACLLQASPVHEPLVIPLICPVSCAIPRKDRMLFWRSGQQRSVATMRLRSGTRETRLKTQLRQSLLVLHEVFAEARRSKGRLWHAAQDAEEGNESRCRKSGYLDRNQTCRADRSGLRRHVSQADRRGIARVDSASDSPACRKIVHHSPGLRSRQGRMNACRDRAQKARRRAIVDY